MNAFNFNKQPKLSGIYTYNKWKHLLKGLFFNLLLIFS